MKNIGVQHGSCMYLIRSMVCYYGQHYMAFVVLNDTQWYMFDDANIVHIGSWSDVISKCEAGRVQASVVFYEKLRICRYDRKLGMLMG